jgi:hypothetical protein
MKITEKVNTETKINNQTMTGSNRIPATGYPRDKN